MKQKRKEAEEEKRKQRRRENILETLRRQMLKKENWATVHMPMQKELEEEGRKCLHGTWQRTPWNCPGCRGRAQVKWRHMASSENEEKGSAIKRLHGSARLLERRLRAEKALLQRRGLYHLLHLSMPCFWVCSSCLPLSKNQRQEEERGCFLIKGWKKDAQSLSWERPACLRENTSGFSEICTIISGSKENRISSLHEAKEEEGGEEAFVSERRNW